VAAVAVLLGVGIAPCPECGMPLVIHIWPLALLLAFTRIVGNRNRPQQDEQTISEPQHDPDSEKS